MNFKRDKTEFFLIANRKVSAALSNISLKLDELSIQRSTSIKNLGVTFDDSLSMYSQLNTIYESVNFHKHKIWRIRRFITTDACHHIIRGLVLSPLNYANSLLFGVRGLTLLIYNTCRTMLRSWLRLADRTSPLLTCSGNYIDSLLDKELYTNSCCMSTKPEIIWLLVTFLPRRISRTRIPLNVGNDCDPP